MRGGVSLYFRPKIYRGYLPRMRGGVSGSHARGAVPRTIFPACAGVFPEYAGEIKARADLPRMRGGVSYINKIYMHFSISSPHARGCFSRSMARAISSMIFPACAGVFPLMIRSSVGSLYLPRMRGGVSGSARELKNHPESSPHARGCFSSPCATLSNGLIFPACAGVFLNSLDFFFMAGDLPRMRGGVSCYGGKMSAKGESSPHARGCF